MRELNNLKTIDSRFILTPFATTSWNVNGVEFRKRCYIFGFKVADLVWIEK
jgi:hypothetical protein